MRALVTGAGGFLGSHLVRLLAAQGHAVTAWVRSPSPALETAGATLALGDLRTAPVDALARTFEGHDVVFHLAARAGVSGPLAEYEAVNVHATRRVFEACAQAGVTRLVYTSTPSVVFGDGDLAGVDESVPYPARFLSRYAQTKARAEAELLARSGERNVHVCALRPHAVFGPGDRHIVPRLLLAARAGRLPRIGDGRNRVDLTFVTDAARAHLDAAIALGAGQGRGRAYFISQGEPVLLWDFIAKLLQRLGLRPPAFTLPLGAAQTLGAVLETIWALPPSREPPLTRYLVALLGRTHWFDIRAARRDLGYTPRHTMDEAFEQTASALASTGETR